MNKIKRTLNHKPKKKYSDVKLYPWNTQRLITPKTVLLSLAKPQLPQHLVQHKSDFVQGWEFQCMIQNTQGLQISERRVT